MDERVKIYQNYDDNIYDIFISEAQKIFTTEDNNMPLIENNNEVQDEEDINISSGEESHNYINRN